MTLGQRAKAKRARVVPVAVAQRIQRRQKHEATRRAFGNAIEIGIAVLRQSARVFDAYHAAVRASVPPAIGMGREILMTAPRIGRLARAIDAHRKRTEG